MEDRRIDPSQVKGWGVDTDLKNDPTYPMKRRTDGEHAGYTWDRPPQQPVNVEVLHSNERPNVSAVFGTAVPPSGLSGVIRRFAFRYSESSYGHWLPLMLADRINVFEGILHDVVHGRFPMIFQERGWNAELRYNPTALFLKVITAVLIIGVALGGVTLAVR